MQGMPQQQQQQQYATQGYPQQQMMMGNNGQMMGMQGMGMNQMGGISAMQPRQMAGGLSVDAAFQRPQQMMMQVHNTTNTVQVQEQYIVPCVRAAPETVSQLVHTCVQFSTCKDLNVEMQCAVSTDRNHATLHIAAPVDAQRQAVQQIQNI